MLPKLLLTVDAPVSNASALMVLLVVKLLVVVEPLTLSVSVAAALFTFAGVA